MKYANMRRLSQLASSMRMVTSVSKRLEHARRREVVRRPDLAHVGDDGVGGLRAVDAEADEHPLRVREDVLADPGHRQVGEHLLASVRRSSSP
jgi:hypothetical protein